MRLDMSGVDRKLIGNSSRSGDLLKHAFPDSLARPAIVAVVERRARSIGRWQIAPATTRLQDVQDAADHPAIVDPTRAWPTMWQLRLDHGPSFVTQPVEVIHGRLQQGPTEDIESE